MERKGIASGESSPFSPTGRRRFREASQRISALNDVFDDEIEILLRYDQIFHQLMQLQDWTVNFYGKNGIVDWSLSFAIHGPFYFDWIHGHLHWGSLRSSTVLAVTMAAYCDPPSYDKINPHNYYMALVGISLVANVSAVICYVIFGYCCDKPYSLIDSMIARVRNHPIYIFGMFFEIKGVLAMLGAIMMARQGALGAVSRDFGIGLFLIITAMWAWTLLHTDEIQDRKVKHFYNKYVDLETGYLFDSVLQRIYRPTELSTFLEIIGQKHRLPYFEGLSFETVLMMEKEDFKELFAAGLPSAPQQETETTTELLAPLQVPTREKDMYDANFLAEECVKARLLPKRPEVRQITIE